MIWKAYLAAPITWKDLWDYHSMRYGADLQEIVARKAAHYAGMQGEPGQ